VVNLSISMRLFLHNNFFFFLAVVILEMGLQSCLLRLALNGNPPETRRSQPPK
jgi:hypothetical protein